MYHSLAGAGTLAAGWGAEAPSRGARPPRLREPAQPAVAAQAQRIAASTEVGSDLYFDWERTNIYKLERGEGECMV